MSRVLLYIMAFGVLIAATAGGAPAIYGSAYVGSTGQATLYRISPTTGAAAAIGPIGFQRVGSLDFASSGTLYGVGSNGVSTVLITINITTGAGTQVGSLGLGNTAFQDIAFRPGDGKLFGFAGGLIYTINTATGAATLVGSAGVGFPDGNGIAFSGNTLYYGANTTLYTLNQNTGAATVVEPINYPPAFGPNSDRPPAMKFDPSTGVLWAVVANGDNPGALFSLATINTANGQATFVGSTQNGIDGLAITAGGGGAPAASGAPALTPFALGILAVLLAATALLAFGLGDRLPLRRP